MSFFNPKRQIRLRAHLYDVLHCVNILKKQSKLYPIINISNNLKTRPFLNF